VIFVWFLLRDREGVLTTSFVGLFQTIFGGKGGSLYGAKRAVGKKGLCNGFTGTLVLVALGGEVCVVSGAWTCLVSAVGFRRVGAGFEKYACLFLGCAVFWVFW